MSCKALFVRYVPHMLCGADTTEYKSLLAAANSSTAPKTVLVLKSRGSCLSIQGFPDVSSIEKHQCWSFFQRALKRLLAVQEDTAICIRFSSPPCTVISSMSQILQERSERIDIIVTPLPCAAPATQSRSCRTSCTKQTGRDPYCQYKELFHSNSQPSATGQAPAPIKRKYDFAAMSRLLSELDELSLTLERTQEECDKIAKRCGPAKPSLAPSPQDKTPLTASDSGKGSSGSCEDHTDGLGVSGEDKKVERLLEVAESIAQHLPHASRGHPDGGSSGEEAVSLPDPPTGVTVQPSVTEGGVYVMWNPVRLDASEQNHGHTVRGYMVYLDKRLRAKVDGPLTSHAELLQGLEEGRDYLVQVCTHTNDCNSLLSSAFRYRHINKRSRQSQLKKTRVEQQQQESKSKAARVESWLLNGHISQPETHTLANGVRGSISEGHTPHVHFATGNSDGHHGNKWVEQVDVGAQLMDSGCEDTRSNASSHTSGIVTDFPMSPHVKQAPVFSCLNCHQPILADAHSLSTHPQADAHSLAAHPQADAHSLSTHISNIHSVSDDGFHTLTHCMCLETGSTIATKSTHSSTLCPSRRSSRAGSEDITVDTVIDEPLQMSPVRQPSRAGDSVSGGRVLRLKQRRPEAPRGLSVYREAKWLLLEWEPVCRDSKGYNNGFFILGYRIYVNDMPQMSVDGAMTCQAKIPCPTSAPRQPIRLDVRSRAMAGESTPSSPVHFNLMTQSKKPCDVMSNSTSCNLRCPSIGSLAVTTSESSGHTIQARNTRVETYV